MVFSIVFIVYFHLAKGVSSPRICSPVGHGHRKDVRRARRGLSVCWGMNGSWLVRMLGKVWRERVFLLAFKEDPGLPMQILQDCVKETFNSLTLFIS